MFTLQRSCKICQVLSRLRKLELLQDVTGNNHKSGVKSERGGPAEVMVKHKMAWQHEAILWERTGHFLRMASHLYHNGSRGFCRNILEEKDNGKCKWMIR